jgi:hypothetical protein
VFLLKQNLSVHLNASLMFRFRRQNSIDALNKRTRQFARDSSLKQ